MSFERYRVQLMVEKIFKCSSLEEWNLKKNEFSEHILIDSEVTNLKNELLEDSKDLYFKGLISLFESLFAVKNAMFSWATVKLYYSVFYFIKCKMALSNIALIRNKSLYTWQLCSGEKPITKGNKKYNSDHSGTINYYIDIFNNQDVLLTQKIENIYVYEWLMNKREQVNYRERSFNEPGCSDFWKSIQNSDVNQIIEKILADNEYIFPFQEEYAILAIPIRTAILTKSIFCDNGYFNIIDNNKKKHLISINPFYSKNFEFEKLIDIKN